MVGGTSWGRSPVTHLGDSSSYQYNSQSKKSKGIHIVITGIPISSHRGWDSTQFFNRSNLNWEAGCTNPTDQRLEPDGAKSLRHGREELPVMSPTKGGHVPSSSVSTQLALGEGEGATQTDQLTGCTNPTDQRSEPDGAKSLRLGREELPVMSPTKGGHVPSSSVSTQLALGEGEDATHIDQLTLCTNPTDQRSGPDRAKSLRLGREELPVMSPTKGGHVPSSSVSTQLALGEGEDATHIDQLTHCTNPTDQRRTYRRNESTVSKLSTRLHKIKGALRAPTVDGHPFDTDVLPLDTDTEFGEELEEEEERDLTSYRIKINNADTKLDLVTGKLTPTYMITVQKLGDGGRLEEEWCVERRLADFYSLEGKLIEFHGDFPDTQLPPCGLLAPSPPTNPDVYETYLQKLIANPSLRGSDLIYRFLTPSSLDFGAEDNAFGRLLRKSVPLSLRKERGQNTDHFIATFFQSTDTKKSKSEWKEGSCDIKPRNIRCLTNTVFRDNLGISLYNFPQSPPANGPTVLRVTGPSDALLIFGAKVFKVPNFLLRLALAVHSLLNKGLDSMCSFYIEKKLRSLLVPQRISHLIHLFQWIVFEKQTKSDPKEVASKVEERISQLSGVRLTFHQTLYKLVQNRILNKQLLYTILDLVLDELFPETANISK
ncbi:hypothetical protein GE061_006732 [Apolygus lucorum]|uniref:PX domain-containing protein n=1 Tax=Apolygus lucorum TaxID=248454 RepID=A0A8S9WW33_APOLU|nr:hypothetical protein GE061_006732 [Apolygus lucorum]